MQMPSRIRILYLILAVLVVVSVVPMYFYSTRVVAINRDQLKTNERLLQNTITRSLAEDIGQRQRNLLTNLTNFASAIEVSSGGSLDGDRIQAPQLRAALERFVSGSGDIAYAMLVNAESKGISAGRISPDAFMTRDLEHGFAAAREGRTYNGEPLSFGGGKDAHPMMLVTTPILINGQFSGMAATFVDLQYLVAHLRSASQGGLTMYVIDSQGRLVAGGTSEFATGQDMRLSSLVRDFVEQAGKTRFSSTEEFNIDNGKKSIGMLGTYSPVANLGWAVVAQKTQAEAYRGINEMQHTATLLAIAAIVVSIIISYFATRRLIDPLQVLTDTSRAIASGDFTQRVKVNDRTEIGELAATFNSMTENLEHFVADLKRAAEENRELFLASIQMLAGAVDEKDPYTRNHSNRVTNYSVIIATEMGLSPEEIDKVRIAAQMHDVGKIGIEDRILKKPGALTPDEFELMKAHTTKGANILRSVSQLADMIPGIELHHESLDGRGYPYGLKGDEIPLMARIIMVADTFDAMTTNRPYQAAMDPDYVIRIINSLAGTKFDPTVVAALTSVFEQGRINLQSMGSNFAPPPLIDPGVLKHGLVRKIDDESMDMKKASGSVEGIETDWMGAEESASSPSPEQQVPPH
jgi:HD-GYP domain-containing protein (c-di-GMP phosphodiesterase class II)